MYYNKLIGGNMRVSRKVVIGIVSLVFMVTLFAGSAFAADPLVETKWLADNLSNVKVVFVDNWPSDKEQYMQKHVKGSVYMGIGALMGALGDGTNPPDQAKFEGIMHRLGISNGDHVVLYGAESKSVFTLGAFWLMEYFGHKKISYLNGGLAKWNAEGLPSEGGMKKAEPGKYKAGNRDESIRIDAAGVLASLGSAAIVDARGTAQYTGAENNDKNKRVGHLPGAKDLDSVATNFNADHTVKSVADLKAVYDASGVTADKNVITYCQAGIKASNAYFILKHVLGYKNVKMYVGSWSEWGNRVDFDKYPIEK
jgi:thiosulfate/3-mercaptopyruvate sulfurtransferase